MNKALLAACVALPLTLAAGSALADDYYGGRYYGGNDHYRGGYGYGGYDNRYRYGNGNGYGYGGYDNRDGNGNFYDRGGNEYYRQLYWSYLNYLGECRRHQALHRQLHQDRDEAREYGYNYWDSREASREAHDEYHRNHPISTFCPTFEQYRRQYPYQGGNYWGRNGWGENY